MYIFVSYLVFAKEVTPKPTVGRNTISPKFYLLLWEFLDIMKAI